MGGIYSRNSSNQASIQVKVERNKNEPKFNERTYTKKIPQTQNAEGTLVSVRASDADSRVCFRPKSGTVLHETWRLLEAHCVNPAVCSVSIGRFILFHTVDTIQKMAHAKQCL